MTHDSTTTPVAFLTAGEILDALAAIGVEAFCDPARQGVATIYVGKPYRDDENVERWPAMIGPGGSHWGDARLSEFPVNDLYCGPDDDRVQPTDTADTYRCTSLEEVVAMVKRLVAHPPTIEELLDRYAAIVLENDTVAAVRAAIDSDVDQAEIGYEVLSMMTDDETSLHTGRPSLEGWRDSMVDAAFAAVREGRVMAAIDRAALVAAATAPLYDVLGASLPFDVSPLHSHEDSAMFGFGGYTAIVTDEVAYVDPEAGDESVLVYMLGLYAVDSEGEQSDTMYFGVDLPHSAAVVLEYVQAITTDVPEGADWGEHVARWTEAAIADGSLPPGTSIGVMP